MALGPDGKIYAIGGYGGGNNRGQEGEKNEEPNKQENSNCLKTAERFDYVTG